MLTRRWQQGAVLVCAATIACVPQEDEEQTSATESTASTSTGSTTSESASDGGPSTGDPTTSTADPSTSGSGAPESTTSNTSAEDTLDTTGTSGTPDTTGAADAICGDGVIEGDEQCDDGQANGDNAACKDDCSIAYCGDGKIQLGKEACDFGEDDGGEGQYNGDGSYGGCTELCQLGPHCGDNTVQEGDEDCEKMADKIEDGSQCVGCKWNAHLIFVTSERFSGDLGGLEGADIKCQSLAAAAKLPNPSSFMAWLSDGEASPQSRFSPPLKDTYILPNGLEVASSWEELVSETNLGSAIKVDETKTLVTKPQRAWSNTSSTGFGLGGADCNGWKSGEIGAAGSYGDNLAVDATWSHAANDWCSQKNRLYCVGSVG